jgi:ribosomal protein L14
MLQPGSVVKVCDKTSIVLGRCIKVLGPRQQKIAKIGDLILISVI